MKQSYGVLFEHQGFLMQGLQRIYMFVSVKLPSPSDLLHDPDEVPDCTRWADRRYKNPRLRGDGPEDLIHQVICKQFQTAYETLMNKVHAMKRNITTKIHTTLPALLPNPIVQSHEGRAVKLPNGEFWHGSEFQRNQTRGKRAIPLPILFAGVNTIGGLVIKGVNSYINYKRNKAMSNAVEQLYKNDKMFHNRIMSIEERQVVMAKTTNKRFELMKNKIERQDRKIDRGMVRLEQFMNATEAKFVQTNQALNNHNLAIRFLSTVFTYYTTVLREHVDFYEVYDRMLDNFLTGLDTLAEGILSHSILDPLKLQRYLMTIERNVIDNSKFQLAFVHTYQYYAEPMITFTNSPDELILQIPLLIKRKDQVPMSLYSMKTAPVPMDDKTYVGENNEYTLIEVKHPYMATTPHAYIPLNEQQLRLCTRLGPTYYCENAHLLRDRSEHTCASAVFYDAGSEAIVQNCKPKYVKSSSFKPIILDAGDLLVLSNLPTPWVLVCDPHHRPIQIEPSTYRILNRSELCECSLSAGAYFLGQTRQSCDDSPLATDGTFQTYYTFNAVIFDVLKSRFNIDLEQSLETMLDGLLSDIPIYRWMQTPWYESDEEERQDIIENLKEEEIDADLEQIMDIMIQQTYDVIYKSKADFEDAQNKFETFFNEAQMWEKLSLVGSLLGWLNIVAWIIIIISCRPLLTKIIASLPIIEEYTIVHHSQQAPTKPYAPIFTMPTMAPEEEHLAPAHMAISVTTILLIVCTCLFVLYCIYKRYKYKSSLMRVCFPLYPLSRILRGKFHTDIFVEITNLRTSQTLWAHFAQVAEYPSRLRVTGRLNSQNIRIMKVCCCRQMHVNWHDVLITTDTEQVVKLRSTGAVSVFTPTEIHSINPDEPYSIRILGRVLDHVMELPTIDSPENTTTPRAHSTGAAIAPSAPAARSSSFDYSADIEMEPPKYKH